MSYTKHIKENLQLAGYCLLLFFTHLFHAFYPLKGGHVFIYFLEEKITGIRSEK